MSTTAILPATVLPAKGRPPGRSHRRALGALVSLVVNFGAPVLAYYLIRPQVGSSALALALSGAIPAAYTLAVLVIRRRPDVLALISLASFGIGVLVSWASGGNALALELQEPVLAALIGFACLVSVAISRPLHPVILRLLGRNDPRYNGIADRAQHGSSMVTTLLIGLTFASHGAALIVLAVAQPASTFVALQRPVGLSCLGVGLAALFLYRSRLQARQSATYADQP
jgi:hypothetical protein